jgi:hypothetical protein
VHGGFVDGGGWEGVFDLLKKDGNDVSIVQNPTLRRGCDPADHRAGQNLCGAGGRFLRRCRDGNDPKVSKLVYIAAFAPDKGESVASLIKGPAPGAPVTPILPPQDGFLFLDRAKFAASFAARRRARQGPVHG